MTLINPNQHNVVLINTFNVKPERQQELIALLDEVTENVMKKMNGFISATLHRSLEGNQVVNYAQWKSLAHYKMMLENPKAQEHMQKAAEIAESFEPVFYEVMSAHTLHTDSHRIPQPNLGSSQVAPHS